MGYGLSGIESQTKYKKVLSLKALKKENGLHGSMMVGSLKVFIQMEKRTLPGLVGGITKKNLKRCKAHINKVKWWISGFFMIQMEI